MSPPIRRLLFALSLATAFIACRRAEVENRCVEDPSACPACSTDAECAFQGNSCTEVVYCAHEQAEIAVVAIGCSPALEYSWPEDSECRCESSVCRANADR